MVDKNKIKKFLRQCNSYTLTKEDLVELWDLSDEDINFMVAKSIVERDDYIEMYMITDLVEEKDIDKL